MTGLMRVSRLRLVLALSLTVMLAAALLARWVMLESVLALALAVGVGLGPVLLADLLWRRALQ